MSVLDDPDFQEEFRERQKQWKFKTYALWRDGLNEVFGGNPARSARWSDVSAIADVLDRATHSTSSESSYGGKFVHAYIVFPDGGDSAIHGADVHNENGCIVLRGEPSHEGGYVLKPDVLKFEAPGGNLHYSYFWLRAGRLEPTGIYPDNYYEGEIRESLCEVRPGKYIDIDRWEEGMWTRETGEREPLPDSATSITRYLEGDLLICCKSSPYKLANPKNTELSPKNGLHARLGEDKFRSMILSLVESDGDNPVPA